MKKVISIMLVLAMACALFIVPAHAHEVEETATPYALACPEGCGGTTSTYTVNSSTVWDGNVDGCTNNPMTHIHGHYYVFTHRVCNRCGHDDVIASTKVTVCPYG